MNLGFHFLLLFLAFGGIWLSAGFVVRAVDILARRLKQNSFVVAFLVLGLLTSITEMSVAINSTLNRTPHLSVGNLVGGSLVIFLLIIPALAFFGGGVQLRHALRRRTLLVALLVIALPSLAAMRGSLDPLTGLGLVAAYGFLLFSVARQKFSPPRSALSPRDSASQGPVTFQTMKILGAGVVIFLISRVLVEEAVYVAEALAVPTSFVGLLVLSVGTNIPEITIAVRAIISGKKEIAFGNYVGSAAINTLILGLLILTNGGFAVDITEFAIAMPFILIGLGLFYRFSRTQDTLSAKEGLALASLGFIFVLTQILAALLAH